MRQKTENSGEQFPKTPYSFMTPYTFANLAVKTGTISFSVSLLTQPFNFVLNRIQSGTPSAVSGGLFRGMYRGFLPYAIAGQKRGAVAVTAKQTNRVQEELVEEEGIDMVLLQRQRFMKAVMGTVAFSQFDLLVSNGLGGKSRLENLGIITKSNFKWSFTNWWKLTTVNWGSRSSAGFVNFAAIGVVGDYCSSLYKFNDELYNKMLGGATAGVLATLFTTIPNSYADRKLLASKVENGRLLTVTPYTMFKQMKSHVNTIGVFEAVKTFIKFNYLKEVAVRSPQTALTFGIIFGIDHMMGDEPLRRVWPGRGRVQEVSSEEPSNTTPKSM
ncbi:periplasmic ligand-binding sensor domain protein [Legionella lansingensis]|uniref:Periplasmic ligand-binding sensor domain protein n=1 Tax=Legionella lansingensis TaxID=45067 RepID=A0A0W0VJH6_9GAMM|nr:hypothetical protein [Legionella lansingensis]KTD20272.1 periplasmic ligand-binding sensor domain protein [Legionella lansingensis]SNV50281.1 periplasmic ligand-binding sensor domain protein [Legionella lansingensis]